MLQKPRTLDLFCWVRSVVYIVGTFVVWLCVTLVNCGVFYCKYLIHLTVDKLQWWLFCLSFWYTVESSKGLIVVALNVVGGNCHTYSSPQVSFCFFQVNSETHCVWCRWVLASAASCLLLTLMHTNFHLDVTAWKVLERLLPTQLTIISCMPYTTHLLCHMLCASVYFQFLYLGFFSVVSLETISFNSSKVNLLTWAIPVSLVWYHKTGLLSHHVVR